MNWREFQRAVETGAEIVVSAPIPRADGTSPIRAYLRMAPDPGDDRVLAEADYPVRGRAVIEADMPGVLVRGKPRAEQILCSRAEIAPPPAPQRLPFE